MTDLLNSSPGREGALVLTDGKYKNFFQKLEELVQSADAYRNPLRRLYPALPFPEIFLYLRIISLDS